MGKIGNVFGRKKLENCQKLVESASVGGSTYRAQKTPLYKKRRFELLFCGVWFYFFVFSNTNGKTGMELELNRQISSFAQFFQR